MYYTNYFNGIDISALKEVCEQCISSLRTAGQTTISFSGAVETNMSEKLENALSDNKTEIDSLISAFETYKSALTIASEIVSKQTAMKDETAEAAIASAAEVQTKLKSFCSKMDELSSLSTLVSSISGISSFEFKANTDTLDNAKVTFDNYSNNLITGYDTLEGTKSTVSSDAYLYKGWIVLANKYDYIMKRRDNLDNLLTNYIANIKTLESKLPSTTAITDFDDSKTSVYAKDHSNLTSDTSYDDYSKSGRGEEIVIPSTDPTSSSSSGTSTSYTVNSDGTVTYKDSDGNVTGKTVKDVNEITGWDYYKIAQYKAQGLTNEEIIAKYNKEQIAKASEARQAEYQRNYTAAQHRAEAAAHGYEASNYGYAQYIADKSASERQAAATAKAEAAARAEAAQKTQNTNYYVAQKSAEYSSHTGNSASNYQKAQWRASYSSKH